MFVSAAPGRIGLDADNVGIGRAVPLLISWLMLREIRRRSPATRNSRTMTPRFEPIWRSTLTL